MRHTSAAGLQLKVQGTDQFLELGTFRCIVAGYTGRDRDVVRAHIEELAAIGVTPPPRVPMFYPMDPAAVSTDSEFSVSGGHTSGELEPVLVRSAGRYFLGIGSDHTDRELEAVDVGDSKRACPKPIGDTVVFVDDWRGFDWDACRVRTWVDGRLYQDGTLAALCPPQVLLETLAEQTGDDDGDLVCFAGTVPLIGGQFVYGQQWRLELSLPDGHILTDTYMVNSFGEGV